MAIRTDIFDIDWTQSPRVINIALAFAEVSAQDLYDTCRHLEVLNNGTPEDSICDAGGWEPLGQGKYVGITVSLFNAVYKFADRPGPDWVICNMTGGNVVGFTDSTKQTEVYPRLPSAYVSADRTASSSATTQELEALEYASFDGGVTVDVSSPYSGTGYTAEGLIIGTPRAPVNNIDDAYLICQARGFDRIYPLGLVPLDTLLNFKKFMFAGRSHVNCAVEIDSVAEVEEAVFAALTVKGTLDGDNEITNCVVEDLSYVNGHIHSSGLAGKITLAGSKDAVIDDCITVDPNNPPEIDMGGGGQNLSMPNYSGLLTLENLNQDNFAGIGLLGGEVVLKDTITAGTIHVSGDGGLFDESGNHVDEGTWNGGVTIINHTSEYRDYQTLLMIEEVLKLTGNKVTKNGDVITLYEDDGTTPWRQYNLANGGRIEV